MIICFSISSFFTTKPTDYRDGYCGNYACKRIHKYLTTDEIHLDTTNFTVNISKNNTDSLINIETAECMYVAKLANNKVIGKNYHAVFSNDSLYFTYTPSMGPRSFRYIGKK